MSIMATVARTEGWVIEENVITEELVLTVRGVDADYEARNGECAVHLSASVISAIRGLKPKQVPHLRRARKEVFSERSRKGWVTRRSDREDRLVLDQADPGIKIGTITSSGGTLRCTWSEPEPAGVFAEGGQLIG